MTIASSPRSGSGEPSATPPASGQTLGTDLLIRVHGDASLPTLVYLPGLHGDWTLVSSFRAAMAGKVRLVEFAYPRTTTWSLDEHAAAIENALLSRGIVRGWLLGESFGSQPAWQMVGRVLKDEGHKSEPTNPSRRGSPPSRMAESRLSSTDLNCGSEGWLSSNGGDGGVVDGVPLSRPRFQVEGLILAGGFVRHPVIWAVRGAGRVSGAIPMGCLKLFCFAYARYAEFRHKRAPETFASIAEFVANRTEEADRRAIVHRYTLIADNDLRAVARGFGRPVFYLAGLVDPLVPWCCVRWWLRRHCPGYHGGKTIWRADHNVLGTAPQASAQQVLEWMNGGTSALPAGSSSTTEESLG